MAAASSALAAAAAVGLFVLMPGQEPSASAAVLSAANHTAEVNSLRGRIENVNAEGADGKVSTVIEASGDDFGSTSVIPDATGAGSHTLTTALIGDKLHSTWDGRVQKPIEAFDELRMPPFADSARDVIRAALGNGNVQNRGTEMVRGVETTHYRVHLTAGARQALGALGTSTQSWFSLELESATEIDVWVADNLVRRMVVQEGGDRGVSTSEFYDFGAPITIRPPSGS